MRRVAYVAIGILALAAVIWTVAAANWRWILAHDDLLKKLSGWITFAFTFAYYRWPWFFLWVQKVRFFLWDVPCRWDVAASYAGPQATIDTLNRLEDGLAKKYVSDFRVVATPGSLRRIYRIVGVPLEVSLDDYSLVGAEGEGGRINVSISDFEVNYKRTMALLGDVIGPMFEHIQRTINADTPTYSLRASFGKINPYYGLFLQRLKAQHIAHFNVEVVVDRERITVNKDTVEINADSVVHLVTLAGDYLALSPKGAV